MAVYTAIDDPSAHFITTLYTGNGSDDRSITNSANAGDFKPDLLWIKERDQTRHHILNDSNRGATKNISTSLANAESTGADGIQAFETNGFQLGTDSDINLNTGTYVAWQWKANGGTTSSDTNGVITSTVQANTTAGFSITKFDSTSTTGEATVGHGLGAVPHVIIMKDLVQGYGWDVHHIVAGSSDADGRLVFNGTAAWNNASNVQAFGVAGSSSSGIPPTSTTFSFNQAFYGSSGDAKIIYCFTPIQGYSKFGSYIGNGNADGTFVYTGFKPGWLMVKRSDGVEPWAIYDNKRDAATGNPNNKGLYANTSDADNDASGRYKDFLSNGFKPRGTSGEQNSNGATYVYLAFAESPFVTSTGIPATAR